MLDVRRVRNAYRFACRRCGGYLLSDFEGDLTCLMCGRAAIRLHPVLEAGDPPHEQRAA